MNGMERHAIAPTVMIVFDVLEWCRVGELLYCMQVMARLRRLRAGISHHDSAERFTKLGVDVYMGRGEFTSHSTVQVHTVVLCVMYIALDSS